jgi:hypothetical protein
MWTYAPNVSSKLRGDKGQSPALQPLGSFLAQICPPLNFPKTNSPGRNPLQSRSGGGKALKSGMPYARFSKLRPVNNLKGGLVSLIIKSLRN